MSYEPTNWKDRVVEKPRTFTMQQNPDGTITLVPAPGTVVQEGTPVNAANLNKLENGLVSHLADYALFKQHTENDIAIIRDKLEIIPESGLISWAEVQSAVRAGEIGNYLQVGDQLVSLYDGDEITWEVIGIDQDTPVDTNYTHSLTMQTRDCLHNIQFDAQEPSNPNGMRKTSGNNRYIHSAIRQWLNSNESTFQWVSQHQYDAPPTNSLDLYDGAGFLARLDPELVEVLGQVSKKVARNTVTDGGGQDAFSDKIFLLSVVEAGFSSEGDTIGEIVYPYYNNISDAGRIKILGAAPRGWWLRSPWTESAGTLRTVGSDGSIFNYGPYSVWGLAPACCII